MRGWGVFAKQLENVRLCAWNMVSFSTAVTAPVQVLVANPAARAVIAQGLLVALVTPAVWYLPLIAIVGTSTARTRTIRDRYWSDHWIALSCILVFREMSWWSRPSETALVDIRGHRIYLSSACGDSGLSRHPQRARGRMW